MTFMPGADVTQLGAPTLVQVRDWTGVPTTAMSDEQLQEILNAETATQSRYCIFPAGGYGDASALFQACLRRCAREIAARGLPLGLTSGDVEYGPVRLPNLDTEIERLEGPFRVIAVA